MGTAVVASAPGGAGGEAHPAASAGAETAAPPDGGGRWTRVAFVAGLFLAAFVCYLPSLRGGLIWDDNDFLFRHPLLRDPRGLRTILLVPTAAPDFYPFTYASFWLEYRLWGPNPPGYRVVNLLLHAGNAALFWLLLRRLAVPGAWLAAAVFALHPVHVESVAWIIERKNTLSTFFYLLAMLAYLRFNGLAPPEGSRADASPEGRRGRWVAYAAALLLFAAALLSKASVVTFPAAVLLLVWWKRGALQWRDVAPLAPFFVVAGLVGYVLHNVQRSSMGAAGPEWDFTMLDRFLIAGRALCFYTWKLAWPLHLSFVYPRWDVRAFEAWQYAFPGVVVAVLLMLRVMLDRWGRGPMTAVLFFAGTLVPALGFYNIYFQRFSFVADHFQYTASMGLIALGAAGVVLLWRRLRPRAGAPGRGGAGWRVVWPGTVLLVSLGVLTWRRSAVFTGGVPVWADTVAKTPNSWMPRANLGALLIEEGRAAEAVPHLRAANELKRNDPEIEIRLGLALALTGETERGIALVRKGVWANPYVGRGYFALAQIYERLGEDAEAIRWYEAGLDWTPDPKLRADLARAYARTGQSEKAAAAFGRAARDEATAAP